MKKNTYLAEIGERLKKKRKELNIRQRDMAETLGIAPTYLSELENGKGNPGPDIFVKLASIYKIDLHYLFLGKENIPVKMEKNPAITNVNISEELDSVDKLVWLMEQSPYIRNSILALAAKFIFEDSKFIQSILDKKK